MFCWSLSFKSTSSLHLKTREMGNLLFSLLICCDDWLLSSLQICWIASSAVSAFSFGLWLYLSFLCKRSLQHPTTFLLNQMEAKRNLSSYKSASDLTNVICRVVAGPKLVFSLLWRTVESMGSRKWFSHWSSTPAS